jgi:hypothetical protein
MGRTVLGQLLIVTTVVIAVVTAWALLAVWRSPDRDGLVAFGMFAVPVGVIATGVIGRAWRAGTRRQGDKVEVPELDRLADLLAEAVRDQWTHAAADRGLLEPEPIAVRWARPSLPLAGPVSAAIGSPRFPPLPGLPVAGQQRLRVGRVRDLHAVYGGLGSGRLVIAGPAGSGKSGAAVLLVLAALSYRAQLPAADRSLVPVPVLFTLHEWDPREQPAGDWLAARLQQTYPSLAGKQGAVRAAALLTAGKIAVILDGLDEMPQELRPVALRSLSQQATFRLVLLTRSAEMAAAAASGLLEGAAAIELQDVTPAAAADYLTRIQLDPAPRGWAELTERLRRDPDSSLARALSSPLTLTLVRDTYRSADDVGEFLEFCDAADGAASPDDIVDLLLDRVLPAAYAPRPGERPPPFDLRTAQQTLRYIAARMNQDGTRDLQWWRIAAWAPAAPRRVLTALIGALVIGPLVGLAVGLTTRSAVGGLWWGFGAGVVIGLMAAPSGGPSSRAGGGDPQRIAPPRWRHVFRSPGLVVGGTTGFAFGITLATSNGHRVSPVTGLTLGLVVGLTLGLAFALAEDISKPRAGNASPLSPLTSWRSDRAHGLTVALAIGLANGILVGLMAGTPGFGTGGLWTGLTAGLGTALGTVLGGTLILPRTWPASLTFAQLAARRHTPVHLMRFLEDARDRNVLRTVGPVYQFRHARLQDRLAKRRSLLAVPVSGRVGQIRAGRAGAARCRRVACEPPVPGRPRRP